MILSRYIISFIGLHALLDSHRFDSIVYSGENPPSEIIIIITSLVLAWFIALLWTRKTACDNAHLAEQIVTLQEHAKRGTIFIDGNPKKINPVSTEG